MDHFDDLDPLDSGSSFMFPGTGDVAKFPSVQVVQVVSSGPIPSNCPICFHGCGGRLRDLKDRKDLRDPERDLKDGGGYRGELLLMRSDDLNYPREVDAEAFQGL